MGDHRVLKLEQAARRVLIATCEAAVMAVAVFAAMHGMRNEESRLFRATYLPNVHNKTRACDRLR